MATSYEWSFTLIAALSACSVGANAGVVILAARMREPCRDLHIIFTAVSAASLSLVTLAYEPAALAVGETAVLGTLTEPTAACTAEATLFLWTGITYMGCLVFQVSSSRWSGGHGVTA